MNRRDAIKKTSLLLGGVLSASAITGMMSGCKAEPKIDWKPRFFTISEADIVEAIAGRIIPATDTPGAIDAGVPGFMDTMLAEFFQGNEKAIFKEGLKQVEADAQATYHKSFVKLTPEQQDEMLTKYDLEAYPKDRKPEEPVFFRMMKELTVLGFCTSELGATKFLKYDPVPGSYRGCVPYSEVGAAWATS
jgi:hypothetical protein